MLMTFVAMLLGVAFLGGTFAWEHEALGWTRRRRYESPGQPIDGIKSALAVIWFDCGRPWYAFLVLLLPTGCHTEVN